MVMSERPFPLLVLDRAGHRSGWVGAFAHDRSSLCTRLLTLLPVLLVPLINVIEADSQQPLARKADAGAPALSIPKLPQGPLHDFRLSAAYLAQPLARIRLA